MKTMLEETLELLQRSKEPLSAIATHAGVNYHWLVKVSRNERKSPNVNDVEKLHRYLKQKVK